jgi:hypothetical protein
MTLARKSSSNGLSDVSGSGRKTRVTGAGVCGAAVAVDGLGYRAWRVAWGIGALRGGGRGRRRWSGGLPGLRLLLCGAIPGEKALGRQGVEVRIKVEVFAKSVEG